MLFQAHLDLSAESSVLQDEFSAEPADPHCAALWVVYVVGGAVWTTERDDRIHDTERDVYLYSDRIFPQ